MVNGFKSGHLKIWETINPGMDQEVKCKVNFCWACLLPRQGYIVFRFIIEYSSLMDFYRPLGNK